MLLHPLPTLALGTRKLSGLCYRWIDGTEKELQVGWLELREKGGRGRRRGRCQIGIVRFFQVGVGLPYTVGSGFARGAVDL